MNGVLLTLSVLTAHWIADFVLQTHWQASNKSKNWMALTLHVMSYTAAVTLLLSLLFVGPAQVCAFALITFAAHFLTDAITSRVTSRLFGIDWHNFFVVVGFDQLLHYTQLFFTIWWLNSLHI